MSDFYDFPISGNKWKKKNSFIMKNENFFRTEILMGYCPFCGLGMLARRQALGARLGAQARALGVLALGVGAQAWGGSACRARAQQEDVRWARRALGAQGERTQGAGACHAQARCRRTEARGAQQGRAGRAAGARGARGRGARDARHERQTHGRASGDTAEGLLRHGASARSARGHARPGRWARGLGAWAGLGQCTQCTRPIFDPF